MIVAAYLPYIGVGSRVLGFLPTYLGEENLTSGGGFWLIELVRHATPVPVAAYLAVAAAVMSGLAIGAFCRPSDPSPAPWATALATAAVFFAHRIRLVFCLAHWHLASPRGGRHSGRRYAVLLYWDPQMAASRFGRGSLSMAASPYSPVSTSPQIVGEGVWETAWRRPSRLDPIRGYFELSA